MLEFLLYIFLGIPHFTTVLYLFDISLNSVCVESIILVNILITLSLMVRRNSLHLEDEDAENVLLYWLDVTLKRKIILPVQRITRGTILLTYNHNSKNVSDKNIEITANDSDDQQKTFIYKLLSYVFKSKI